jgi:hypothetical protein
VKHCTFTRDMKPQRAGEMRLLPDDVAAKLEAEGAIAPNPPDWPAKPQAAPAAETPAESQHHLSRRERRELRRQQYATK